MKAEDLTQALATLRSRLGDRVRAGVPIAPFTTFRLGGAAAIYVEPDSDADLRVVGEVARAADLPTMVVGKGSNVLVSDAGFPGIVIRLGRGFRWTSRDGDRLTAGGAMPLPALSGIALTHCLSGLEFAIAIPATVGGAVRMNAGAHGGSMADVTERVRVFDLEDGVSREVEAAHAGFGYRRSDLGPAAIVVAATVRLSPGAAADIRRRMDEARAWRRETQPVGEPNCGSVFKNPPGDHAARLVEAAGCKGMTIGGASVSEKHANFIIARTGATADDVRRLIAAVGERVRSTSGIELEPEVRFVGGFTDG